MPWEERENGFVCIGRIHPGKRLDWIIETIARTRRIAPRLRLHIVGTRGQKTEEVMSASADSPRSSRPTRRGSTCTRTCPVTSWRTWPPASVTGFTAGGRALRDRPRRDGPAPVASTFVHDSGGQVEIVGNDPRLTFDSTEQAVERISAVVSDPGRQADLVEFLDPQGSLLDRAVCRRAVAGGQAMV